MVSIYQLEFQKKFWELRQEMLTLIYGEKISNNVSGMGMKALGRFNWD